jgi:hypothetical protein
MKHLLVSFAAVIIVLTFTNSSCKKHKDDPINTTCGCNATDIKYQLRDKSGTLSFYQYNSKWFFSVQQVGGMYSSYFPCNTTQDSLQKITQGANQNQVFQVKFSGKVKGTCSGEDFGTTTGGTIDYIIIDSLKRN